MKRITALLILLVLVAAMAAPVLAKGSWFGDIFGVGGAVSAVAEATGKVAEAKFEAKWRIELIRAVKAIWPSLILLTAMIGTIGSAWVSAYLVMRLHGSAQKALKDDKVTIAEWIILGLLSVVTIPTALGLLYFAFFLMKASEAGLSELMG